MKVARLRVVAAVLLVALASACAEPGPRRIVFIVVDTLRSDHLSVYGADVATPNVAALAARGQVFRNVTASFHQTSMSMGAMMTGRTPSIESGDPREPLPWNSSTWCGLARFSEGARDTCIPGAVPTLAERLREAGWWTMGVVSNQFLYEPSGFGRGFEDWIEVDERKPVAGPRSREGVENPRRSRYWPVVNRRAFEAVDRAPEGRSFLYLHYIDVHDYHFLERSYRESVEVMDRALGELLAGLEERGFLQGAVVIFTSDHGERLGEDHAFPGELPNNRGHYGNPSFEEMLRIPLIVAPAVSGDDSALLRTQDFHDLVLRIAGLAPTPSSDTAADELFVSELNFRTLRQGRWKSTLRRRDGKAFLYDLETDPRERHNVAAQKPMRVLAHRTRGNELTKSLSTPTAPTTELSDADRARLQALGYLNGDVPAELPNPP